MKSLHIIIILCVCFVWNRFFCWGLRLFGCETEQQRKNIPVYVKICNSACVFSYMEFLCYSCLKSGTKESVCMCETLTRKAWLFSTGINSPHGFWYARKFTGFSAIGDTLCCLNPPSEHFASTVDLNQRPRSISHRLQVVLKPTLL